METLHEDEVILLQHARGERHNSEACRWCREVSYFAERAIKAERTVKSIIEG